MCSCWATFLFAASLAVLACEGERHPPGAGQPDVPGESGPAGTEQLTCPARPSTLDGGPGAGDGDVARPPPPLKPAGAVRFAVIGDYGIGPDDGRSPATNEEDVAAMVNGWRPDFVVTTGDNTYPLRGVGPIDLQVGCFYSDFIGSYRGAYGPGSPANRFFPCPGNHDWLDALGAYLGYFTLPGNERYYTVERGPLRLYLLDSDPNEPDGTSATSVQARWLQQQLSASTACFDVVVFHHPPYTSGTMHGPSASLRWPFAAWGADVVLSGHEHFYERLEVDGFPYLVNGLGGADIYTPGRPAPGSLALFADDWGAQLVTVTRTGIRFDFVTVRGETVDSFVIEKACDGGAAP